MTNKQIANNFKSIRNMLRLNQTYVSKLIGISRVAYSHFENDKRTLTASELYKLCKVFKVSPNLILTPNLPEELLREVNENYYYSNL